MMNVTKNTEALLNSRIDDFRVCCAKDVMYSDDIGGTVKDRNFTLLDSKDNQKTIHLRKAMIGDIFDYTYVSGSEFMAQTIEENIGNIQRMKKVGASMNGLPPIKDVWVFIFTVDKNGELYTDSFMNPDSRDCAAIIRGEREVIFAGFINTYDLDPIHKARINEINGVKDVINETFQFTFISPMDATKLNEYAEISLEQEAKELEKAFMIHFNTK